MMPRINSKVAPTPSRIRMTESTDFTVPRVVPVNSAVKKVSPKQNSKIKNRIKLIIAGNNDHATASMLVLMVACPPSNLELWWITAENQRRPTQPIKIANNAEPKNDWIK